jgi:hypothetical protein
MSQLRTGAAPVTNTNQTTTVAAKPNSGAGVTRVPKMRRKIDRPSKTCVACGLPFTWRKKWARDWDSVRFCSDRCRSAKCVQKLSGIAP